LLIVLDGERPPSWNKIYSAGHWSKRKKIVDPIHEAVWYAIPAGTRPFKRRVDITVRAYFRSKALDSDNIPAKLYIDGLRGRVIVDDDRRYVRAVTTQSMRDKQRPRVEIEITETGE